MNIKLQIKNRFTGSLIFEYESENNTIKETLLEAVKAKANLRGADLRGANLHGANLYGADLYGANLRDADLYGANLHGANLHGANLLGANLCDADLRGANLHGADLYGADLHDANLYDAKDIPAIAIAQTRVCAEGDIFGYKKCLNGIIVKLLIPKEAKRNNAFGRKCRAEYAKVIEIIGADKAISQHDNSFIYKVGDIVGPTTPFDEDFTNECSTGIHFFITLEEAKNY